MANTKSAIKNARKNTRRALRNQRVKTRLKTLAKKLAKASAANDVEATKVAAQNYVSALDKAANRGIIHPNAVSRRKSVCTKHVFVK